MAKTNADARPEPDVRNRLDATIADNTPYSEVISRKRHQVQSERKIQGWRFIWLGAALILSNLFVIPAMAWTISALIEHPASTAVNDLTDLLEELKSKQTTGGPAEAGSLQSVSNSPSSSSSMSALEALGKLKDQLGEFESSANKLPGILDNYVAAQKSAKTAAEDANSVITTLQNGLGLLENRSATFTPPDTAPGTAEVTYSKEEIAALFTLVSPSSSQVQAHEYVDPWFGDPKWTAKPDKYFIIPSESIKGGTYLISGRDRLNMLSSNYGVGETQKTLEENASRANTLLIQMTGDENTAGLVGEVNKTISEIAEAGEEINDLIKRAPDLQQDAEAAVESLSSTSKFIVPYGFAVLAVGAMFISIGVSSIVKSLKIVDESYEDSRDDRMIRLYAELVESLSNQDVRADALIDRLGRIGEQKRAEQTNIPTPIARAAEAIAEAFKSKSAG